MGPGRGGYFRPHGYAGGGLDFQTRAHAGKGSQSMNFDQYTERARGFVQAAQTGALAAGHQRFTPNHLLRFLLADSEGLAAGLIDRAGGRSRDALAATERALAALPKVSGGNGQLYLAPPMAKVFDTAEKL